jgi:hypothetical protein
MCMARQIGEHRSLRQRMIEDVPQMPLPPIHPSELNSCDSPPTRRPRTSTLHHQSCKSVHQIG